MITWYGLVDGHVHPTVDAMWTCRACMKAHRKTCSVCVPSRKGD